jgi:hypothetical protein
VALVSAHPEEQRRYGAELKELPSAWLKLLRTGSLNTSVVEDTDSSTSGLVALGVSVFIADEVLHELKTPPRAWIGTTLTNRAHSKASGILTAEQIREGNSHLGLNLVIWTGVVSKSRSEQAIHVELFRSFFDAHLGYQIKEIVCQPLDLQQIYATFQAGLFWFSKEGQYIDGRLLRTEELSNGPFLMGSDRETANRAFGSWFSGLLLSQSPARLYFRPSEQRLLLAALSGLTDEELADELGISLSAVKKSWCTIHKRALCDWADRTANNEEDDGVDRKRGKERKQHLLAYLREHMEELRPILPPNERHGVSAG